jgi:hypothetical protein
MKNNELHLEENEILTLVSGLNTVTTVLKNQMTGYYDNRSINTKGILSTSRIPSFFPNALQKYKHILSDFNAAY